MNKKFQWLLSSVLAASSLVGCHTFTKNAYTDNWQVSNTAKGMGVGAITGGAVGGVADASSTTTAGLAVGGAAVGGVAGYQMDQQEAKIRSMMRSSGVRVLENTNDGSNDITLVLPSDVTFASGSVKLTPRMHKVLDAVAMVMQEFKFAVAEIPGNADSIASNAYNKRLSAKRAQAVAKYLESRGVEQERLVPKAYGESAPIASNRTAEGRALNRRMSIILHQPPIQ